MFHQSMSRSQRARGSKAKRTVQVAVLLAAVVWLLYQSKHSYDRKTEVAETNHNKLGRGDTDINFGRKVNAGSQNENSIDVHRDNSDETTETKENGLDGDARNHEETTEVEKESEESQLGNTTNGNIGDASEVDTDGAHGSLRLPSQREGGNFDHGEIKNDSDRSFERNQLTKEGTAENSDGESTTPNEASFPEDGQDAGHGSENGETGGENRDNAEPITEELNDISISHDQSNTYVSEYKDTTHEGETIEAQEDTHEGSNMEIVNETVSSPNFTDENNVARGDSQKEVDSQIGNDSMDAKSVETSSEGGNSNLVIQKSDGSPGSDGESQADVNLESESRATGNNSSEGVTDDKENSSSLLSDNNGSPKDEEIRSQTGNSSEDAKTDTSDGEQSNADVPQEVARDDTVTKDGDSMSSQVAVEEVRYQENNDQDSVEEKPDDVASGSAQNNEQNDSEMQNNDENRNVEVASLEDNSSMVETTGNDVEDATTEPESKDPTTSGSGIEL